MTPGGSNTGVRLAIPTNTDATAVGILSGTSSTAPQLVAEVPLVSGQIASSQYITTAFGSLTAGSAPAGSIDVGVNGNLGSGNASNAAMFANYNTAYALGALTGVNCAGSHYAIMEVNFAPTDLRSSTQVTIIPFLLSTVDGIYYPAPGPAIQCVVGGGPGACLRQVFVLEVFGGTVLAAIDEILGQGTTITSINIVPV
jgi:hypothetical protein